MTVATEAQLRALAGVLLRDERRVLALRADAEWPGPEVVDTAAGPVRVVPCGSPLAVREALTDHGRAGSGERLVVLTPCGEHDLGLDVVARLVSGRVRSLDPWSAVLGLFGATRIDPLLTRDHRWLVEELVALAPGDGYHAARPLAGVLDLETAWRAYHRVRFGLDTPPTTFADVLRHASTAQVGEAIAALPAERRSQVAARWRQHADDPVEALLVVAAGAGRADLVPLGLVLRLVADDPTDAALVPVAIAARTRLESRIPHGLVDAAGAARWADAAEAVVGDAGPLDRAAWLDRAASIVEEIGARDLAARSDVLSSGFDQRRDALGDALLAAIASGGLADAEAALAAVQAHRLAESRSHVAEAAAAAVRLARRITELPASEPVSFAEAADRYRSEASWVDRARELLHEGETAPRLAVAYTELLEWLGRERHDGNARFAGLLADWTRSEPASDDRILPIEDALGTLVVEAATFAGDRPVLVVVFDGLSLPVAGRLHADLGAHGWAGVAPAVRPEWPVVVAALPTVTDVSRASLLAGRRTSGGQQVERDGFRTHPALRALGGPEPVLYHKADLVGPGGNALPESVRATVASPATRFVAAVVNSVDDHLSRGDQVRVDWTVDAIRPLGWLLEAAMEAGRVVVIASDHGHVINHGARFAPAPADGAGGERWRPAIGEPVDGEIELRGPRVLRGDGVVLAPWDERLCYGAPKHGYHGGVSPQEVLVPFAVYARAGQIPDGWVAWSPAEPAWWSPRPTAAPPNAAPPPLKPKGRGRRAAPGPNAPQLFPHSGSSWVDELLGSDTFQRQLRRVPKRQQLDSGRAKVILAALDAAGGTATLEALAAACSMPAVRLRGELGSLRRMLNYDGYEVLTETAGSFRLERALLRTQFGVEAS